MKRVKNVAERCLDIPENIVPSWDEMQKNGRRNDPGVAFYGYHIESKVVALESGLRRSTWEPGEYDVFRIQDPKPRIIAAPDIETRLTQKALLAPVKYDLYGKMSDAAYAGIVGRGPLRACWKIQDFINSCHGDMIFVLHFDFHKCYPSFPHDEVLRRIAWFVKDKWWLGEYKTIVDSYHDSIDADGTVRGLPLGADTSGIAMNLFFTPMDNVILRELKMKYVRCSDDGFIVTDQYCEIVRAKEFIEHYARDVIRMDLNQEKTTISLAEDGVDAFGYIITKDGLSPRHRNVKHALHRIKKLRRDVDAGKEKEQTLRDSLTSFLGYMKYAKWSKWAEQVVEASGLWDRWILKRKIIQPKYVRDAIDRQNKEARKAWDESHQKKTERFRNPSDTISRNPN